MNWRRGIFSGRLSVDWVINPWVRGGFSVALAVVLGLALWQNAQTLKSFETWMNSFGKPILRDAFVVTSDLMRLERTLDDMFAKAVLQPDTVQADPSPEVLARLELELDLIWIRREEFRKLDFPEALRDEAARAQEGLERYVDRVGQLLAAPQEAQVLLPLIHADAEMVRKALLIMVEERRTKAVLATKQNRHVLNASVWSSNAFAVISGFLAFFAFQMLTREILSRKAKQAAERKVQQLAYFDSLTGIANRAKFNETLATWADSWATTGSGFSLGLIDLDKFKDINDTLGHQAGDAVLCAQAVRIEAIAESFGGMAARLSGDEFAVLLPFEKPSRLRSFAKQLITDMAQPVETEVEKVATAGSIGLCAATRAAKGGRIDREILSRSADFALYTAKTTQEVQICIFDERLADRMAQRRSLLAALPGALRDHEIIPYFQPKVDIATGRAVSFEALARWKRDGVLIPPSEFIDMADEAGMVDQIDLLVLRQAVAVICATNQRTGRRLSISSNLSANHFKGFEIVGTIKEILKTTGLPADLLVLEITETSELSDWSQVGRVIGALKKLGCRISIDDFGTGYSSLSYLRAVRADEVKIDRSFLEGIEASTQAQFLLDAIIEIANGLGMNIVVEGVETQAQAQLVQEMGCQIAQGFLYSRPVEGAEIEKLLNFEHLGPGPLKIMNEFPQFLNMSRRSQ